MAKLPEKASDLQLEAAELGRRIDQILEKLHENEFVSSFVTVKFKFTKHFLFTRFLLSKLKSRKRFNFSV